MVIFRLLTEVLKPLCGCACFESTHFGPENGFQLTFGARRTSGEKKNTRPRNNKNHSAFFNSLPAFLNLSLDRVRGKTKGFGLLLASPPESEESRGQFGFILQSSQRLGRTWLGFSSGRISHGASKFRTSLTLSGCVSVCVWVGGCVGVCVCVGGWVGGWVSGWVGGWAGGRVGGWDGSSFEKTGLLRRDVVANSPTGPGRTSHRGVRVPAIADPQQDH